MFTRDITASVNIAAGAEADVFAFDVPGVEMEIYALGFGVSTLSQWASVTFGLRFNGNPIPDFGEVRDEIGSVKEPRDVSIVVPARTRVSVFAKNGDAAAGLFAATLKAREIRR